MKLQNSQKTENRLKIYPEKVYHEKYVKFLITSKTGKLKVQSINSLKVSKQYFVKKFLP